MAKKRKFLIQAYFSENPQLPPTKVILPGDLEISKDDYVYISVDDYDDGFYIGRIISFINSKLNITQTRSLTSIKNKSLSSLSKANQNQNNAPSSELSENGSLNENSSLSSLSDSSDYDSGPNNKKSLLNISLSQLKLNIPPKQSRITKKQVWSDEVKVLISLFHRSDDLNLTKSKVKDVRLLIATMHTESHTITQIRGKCTVKHRSQIPDLVKYVSMEDTFYYSTLFDRYITRLYDVIPVSSVKNVPPAVKKKLTETYEFIVCEPNKTIELTMDLRACVVCSEWCTG
ncbi:Lid2 complex component snt2 [Smittium culicis]|uniref:Lid2 complex component snt2 n=1 Tax=Smittium culicis TaxID=133412 RepID=A0A1R1YTU0_9FUNG|nr:Lid2 complex component snt2 [Smittium culicis]